MIDILFIKNSIIKGKNILKNLDWRNIFNRIKFIHGDLQFDNILKFLRKNIS